jgi:F-type H+-transporting ATPase subunit epsilon
MPLTLEIVTPENRIYSKDNVERVKLPCNEGDIEVLPGHVPYIVAIHPGEVRAMVDMEIDQIAVDKGFAEIYGDKISILTEGAIDVEDIDFDEAHAAEQRALEAIEKAEAEDYDPAEIEKLESIARFSLAQKLIKRPR